VFVRWFFIYIFSAAYNIFLSTFILVRWVGELKEYILLGIIGVTVALWHTIIAGRERYIGQAFCWCNRIAHNVSEPPSKLYLITIVTLLFVVSVVFYTIYNSYILLLLFYLLVKLAALSSWRCVANGKYFILAGTPVVDNANKKIKQIFSLRTRKSSGSNCNWKLL